MSQQFKVSIRVIDGNSSLLGKADVTGAKMTINGFSIMQGKDGKPNWVSEPAVKQGSGFTKMIEIFDRPLKDAITKAILEAYARAVSERGTATQGDDEAF